MKLSDRPQARREIYTVIEDAIANVARDARLMLLEAVNDYEFDTLKFDFVRQNNGVRCVVFTSGRGRTGARQPIGGFTVNINNFGALLSKQFLRSADSVGAVDDLLKRLFEGE